MALALAQTSCEKVSPQGVLMAGTAVEDRVEMSYKYYQQNNIEEKLDEELSQVGEEGYSFLVGADSHITDDLGRFNEMINISLEHKDLFIAHLGDIADTKADYYINLENALRGAHYDYVMKYYEFNEDDGLWYRKDSDKSFGRTYESITFPFFPVVGNHDLTHNGWALWCNIFNSSFYEFDIEVDNVLGEPIYDHFIFLDTASGTLGKKQIELINQGVLDGEYNYRYTFVFSHTNIFRPSRMQFASTFAREEMFFLLDQFERWNATIVFMGHVHAWDEREYNLVTYLTLDSMSERNNPKPGDYLVRVNVSQNGDISWEKVHMDYVAKKS
ncbi:MAG: metallophosphoesterase [Muribaculaceae bacterium]|nr:metallophosphoesterase [Muribaculaceae bacterium]